VSQENVEVVRQHQEVFNRGDMAAMLELTDRNVEWWDRADDPDASVHRGHDALIKHLADFEDLGELRVEPQEFIDAGHFVVVPTRIVGRGRTSGALFEEHQVNVFRVRDGKVTEVQEYRERNEAFKAVGLQE
jgi:ketosteroid isomerase-like protein